MSSRQQPSPFIMWPQNLTHSKLYNLSHNKLDKTITMVSSGLMIFIQLAMDMFEAFRSNQVINKTVGLLLSEHRMNSKKQFTFRCDARMINT
jgi:hypothetical protein